MRRDTLVCLLLMILILAAFAAKSVLVQVPRVQHLANGFDADRAKARLAYILGSQQAHPADSDADDAVRARLIRSLEQLGIQPVVRDQMACNAFERSRLLACARVRNVIARLGPPNGKALLLSAHYDSVPVGPGASDDGIGVATLLEVGSILRRATLERPVLLLFNEGEELGLVGARAFLADPLSADVDSVLNFEARGVNGPVTMFETNVPNGRAIAAYAGAVPRKYASSLSTDVIRLIPNDTDVTVFKERPWLTLNSAIVGNESRYHSPGDDLSGLDPRSLQDMGDEALALATRLSQAPAAAADRENVIFFDLARQQFLVLPLGLGLAWLLFLLSAFFVVSVRRPRIAHAAALGVGTMLAGAVAASIGLEALSLLRAGTFWRAHAELTFMALYATALCAELAVFCSIGRAIEQSSLRVAYWLIFLLLGGLIGLAAPGAIIYFLVPPSIVLAGMLASRWHSALTVGGGIIALLFLYLSWGELLGALEELFSPGPLWMAAAVAAIMIAPALIEMIARVRGANRSILAISASCVALAFWTIAGTAPAYSQDHQQRFTIEHVTQFPSGRSSWSILNDGTSLPGAFASFGQWHRSKLDFSERQRWIAQAPRVTGLRPPAIAAREVAHDAKGRTMKLRFATNGAERVYLFAPASAHIERAGLPGFEAPIRDLDALGKFTISCTGRSCNGAEFTIMLRSDEPVDLTLVGSRNGLPGAATPLVRARPAFARPQYVPDETVTVSHVTL